MERGNRETLLLSKVKATLNPTFAQGLTKQQVDDRLREYVRRYPEASGYLAFVKEPMVWLLAIVAIVYGC